MFKVVLTLLGLDYRDASCITFAVIGFKKDNHTT